MIGFTTGFGRLPGTPDGRRPRVRDVWRGEPVSLDASSQDLMRLYLRAKLYGKRTFGAYLGNYSWSAGVHAAFLAAASAVWIARAQSRAEEAESVEERHVVEALQQVDYSFTHSGVLSTSTEKLRMFALSHSSLAQRIVRSLIG